jgi:hypothetical protein
MINEIEMQDRIDKILAYKTVSDKEKIDRLLFMDADQYTNLGIESTKTAKENTKKNSRRIYRAIKTINDDMGSRFLRLMDK